MVLTRPDTISSMRYQHTLWILCVLVLSLVGCADGEQEVIYVVITDTPPVAPAVAQQPSVENTATPNLPPTLTPPPAAPTPDIPPEISLQIADRFLRDGRFENAVYTYQIILDQGGVVSAEVRAAAAYNMGQAALREGLFDDAVEALTTLITQFPEDYRVPLGYFLRGDAYSGLNLWAQAIADYEQYLILRPGVIDSYAYERIADAQVNLNQFATALDNYNRATQATRSRVPQAALMEKVAQLHLLNNDIESAVAQYDGILAFAQTYTYRASIDLLAAQTLLNSGDVPRGLLRMERVFNDYEGTPAAYEAMLTLIENGIRLDSYQQGRTFFTAERYTEAIDAFNQFTTEVALTEIPPRLYLQLGQAYRAAGNFDAARVAFRTITEQFPNDVLFGDALLEQGRTFFLEGDIPRAIERYLFVAETYGYLAETAAEAFWRAGYLHGTNDNPSESRAIFLRLAEIYPDSEQARSGLSIAASAAIAEGQSAVAETLYSRLATIATGTQQADAYLNLGQLLRARGDAQGAETAFNQAVAAAPDSYYSARAQDIRDGRTPFTSPTQYVWTFDDAAQVAEAENWIRERFGVVQEGPLWPLSPELEQEPRIIRGRELWAVGAFDEARIEFSDVISDYAQDGLASYQLAIYTRIIGAYRPSITAAANLIILSRTPTLQAPAYLARLRYPAYYGEEIRRITAEYNVDPLLLMSLIRHESLFDTYATAAASEKGLTQVIPGTADYIASQLNWPNYEHRDLFRPYAGIEFGTFYLAEQLNRFDGNVYAALAGYNAGPGRAIDWLSLSGGDPDRFMATITISSTQLYVQLIYNNYAMYRQLYGVDT